MAPGRGELFEIAPVTHAAAGEQRQIGRGAPEVLDQIQIDASAHTDSRKIENDQRTDAGVSGAPSDLGG